MQPAVGDRVHSQRVRLARLMANAERDHAEPDRTLGMAHRDHHGAKPSRRRGCVRLHTPADSVPSRPCSSQAMRRFRGRPPRPSISRPNSASTSAPASPSRARSSAMANSSKATGKTGPSALISCAQPSPSRGRSPKCSLSSSGLRRGSPWRARIDSTEVSPSTSSATTSRARFELGFAQGVNLSMQLLVRLHAT